MPYHSQFSRKVWPCVLLVSGFALAVLPLQAQQTRSLTLEQATELALQQNRLLGIAREKVSENQYKVDEIHSKYFPQVSVNALGGYNVNTLDITVPRGAIGVYPDTGPIPGADVPLLRGSHVNVIANVQVAQPLTQLSKVRTGVEVAKTDVQIAETQARQAEWQVRQGVEKLYYGLLIAEQQRQEAELNLQVAQTQLYDVESAILAGKALQANRVGAQANVADQEQKLLRVRNQIEDYTYDLNQTLALPASTRLSLAAAPATDMSAAQQPVATYLTQANAGNLDIQLADQTSQKATLGVKAARKEYLPDVALTANYVRLNGIPLLNQNNLLAGAQLSWRAYDFGGRKAVVKQRLSQQKQAGENLQNTREQVTGQIEKAHRQLQQAAALVVAAQKAVDLRASELKIRQDQLASGLTLKADVLSTQATLAKAQSDLLSAQLNYRLTLTELRRASGAL